MHCFSYGSNMSIKRLQDCVPSAKPVTIATLAAHRLRFHKSSKDGSGKCDAEETGDPYDRVIGVVYDISDEEKGPLDHKEGLGSGYDEKRVNMISDEGELAALMYVATRTNPALQPYHWYKEHVLVGARDNNLPPEYIAEIASVEAIDDPDVDRSRRELAIYR